jgi:regulator of RNase E activity RraA
MQQWAAAGLPGAVAVEREMKREDLAPFAHYYAPLISDTMDRLGIAGQVMDRSIQQMLPAPGQIVCGIAFPCRVVPTAEYVEITTLLEMVDAIPDGSVVVVAADADIGAALWGGLMSTRAQARGAVGAVVSGGVRDLAQIEERGFPVFGAYRCVTDIRRRGAMVAYGATVECGGVTVRPGDVVFGDANGVVVVPAERVPEVAAELARARSDESATMAGLRAGAGAKTLFDKYERF